MSKKYDAEWENAFRVVHEARPPFIPENAEAMTVVITYPPGSAGAPPHRHPGSPAFGYMLHGEMLFELEGQPPRVVRAGTPMLTLVDEEELAARAHLRVPAEVPSAT